MINVIALLSILYTVMMIAIIFLKQTCECINNDIRAGAIGRLLVQLPFHPKTCMHVSAETQGMVGIEWTRYHSPPSGNPCLEDGPQSYHDLLHCGSR